MFIGNINPFRYRGYYYDRETNLYYLNSRYYSPELCRFISPDTLSILDETHAQINGLNLYMYCNDNPVMNVDPSGYNWWNNFVIGIKNFFNDNVIQSVIGTILSVGAIVTGAVLVATGIGNGLGAILISAGIGSAIGGFSNTSSDGSFFAGWFGGACNGVIAGLFPMGLGRIIGNTVGSFAGTLINDFVDSKLGNCNFSGQSFKEAGINALISFGTSLIIGGTFNGALQFCGKEAINEASKGAVGLVYQYLFSLCDISGTLLGNGILKNRLLKN